MREIVGKEEITMTGNMKVIEGVIAIEKEVMMTEEENSRTIEDVIMIEGLIVTEEQGMTLKETESRDHLGEEKMKKELKDDTILMIEEAEALVREEEIKGKIGDEMRTTEKVKIGEVEDLAVHKKTGM